jgi:hypothetical protein
LHLSVALLHTPLPHSGHLVRSVRLAVTFSEVVPGSADVVSCRVSVTPAVKVGASVGVACSESESECEGKVIVKDQELVGVRESDKDGDSVCRPSLSVKERDGSDLLTVSGGVLVVMDSEYVRLGVCCERVLVWLRVSVTLRHRLWLRHHRSTYCTRRGSGTITWLSTGNAISTTRAAAARKTNLTLMVCVIDLTEAR